MTTRTDILLEYGDQYIGEDERSEGEEWSVDPDALALPLSRKSDDIKSMSYREDEREVYGELSDGSEVYIEPEDEGYGIVFWDGEEEYFASVSSKGDDIQQILDAVDQYLSGELDPV